MLTREENETLCRVGPGTAMGQLMREYWMPILRGEALEAGGAPMRVRLLGENFVAFRTDDGRIGLFDEGCPHRCTSLALARNEDNALTCIFHGWKIDVSGKVVEVPSEPPERRAEFAAKVRVRHYPVREAGGIIWAYIGPREQPPKFPDFEFNRLPASHSQPFRALLHCNWLAPMEGTLDSSHLGILHSYWLKASPGSTSSSAATVNTGPVYDLIMQPYGFREAAVRDLFDGTCYTRIRQLLLPFYGFIPQESFRPRLLMCPVPVDDEWTYLWYVWHDLEKPLELERLAYQLGGKVDLNNIWAGIGTIDNRWGQDRQKMKQGHFTGIATLNYEDFAIAEGQGTIADRTREYLGSSDGTIVTYRRLMLNAVREHRKGKPAPGLDQDVDYGKLRAAALRLPKATDWRGIDLFNPPPSQPLA